LQTRGVEPVLLSRSHHTYADSADLFAKRPRDDAAGQVRAVPIPSLEKEVVAAATRKLIEANAHLMTDGGGSFAGLTDETADKNGRPPVALDIGRRAVRIVTDRRRPSVGNDTPGARRRVLALLAGAPSIEHATCRIREVRIAVAHKTDALPGPSPWFLVCVALFILWGFGYETVWDRLTADIDGVIVSSRDVPSKGAPRYATEYVIRGPDGQAHTYVAGPTDSSLERSMPIGTRVHKERWKLGYERDGHQVSFPIEFYSAILGIALACLLWAVLQWRLRRG
jgi:hypothetical protein